MRGHHLHAGLISLKCGCLLVHCLLTVIYFINVPLIEMAAREERRGERATENGCTLLTHITGARRKFLMR